MLGQAVGGVHVQQLNLAGLQSWVRSKAGLPPHVSCVQNDLQNGTAVNTCRMLCRARSLKRFFVTAKWGGHIRAAVSAWGWAQVRVERSTRT